MKRLLAAGAVAWALYALAAPADWQPLLTSQPLAATVSENAAAGDVEIGRDRRTAWTLRAPGRAAFSGQVPPEGRLELAVAAEPAGAAPTLRVVAREGAVEGARLEERLAGGGAWAERRLELGAFAGRRLSFEVTVEGEGASAHVAGPALVGRVAGPARPNVLVYVVDCLRADHVGAYGYTRPTTPQIDRLALDGVVFERVQACASWTKPAVGCLFTSLYPVAHGARTVDDVLDPGVPTLAAAFRQHGYATAAWVANPFVSANPFGLTRGFERVVQMLDKPPKVNINDLPADAADITREVVPWLRAQRDRQFFAYLHSLDLHAEYRRRPPFDRLFVSRERRGDERQRDLYDTELAANDHEIGRLVSVLKREGLYDRTLIVVTADHGEEFGEHGFTRHGHTLYQPSLHVPLVLKLPASARRGTRRPELASSLDLAPTLLALAGLAPQESFSGLNLTPALEGRALPAGRVVFAEQLSPKEVLYAGRGERYKYIRQLLPAPAELLFDLARDPREETSLLPDLPPEARRLQEDVLRFMQQGQTGYHLAIAGRPGAAFRVVATTTGLFQDVQRFALAAGELLDVAADRRRVEYSFTAGAAQRLLVLKTDPPDAELRLTLSADGRPLALADVGVGPDAAPPASLPLRVGGDAARAPLTRASALLELRSPPVRLWSVAGPEAGRKAVIDPELEQKLRALGYIQ